MNQVRKSLRTENLCGLSEENFYRPKFETLQSRNFEILQPSAENGARDAPGHRLLEIFSAKFSDPNAGLAKRSILCSQKCYETSHCFVLKKKTFQESAFVPVRDKMLIGAGADLNGAVNQFNSNLAAREPIAKVICKVGVNVADLRNELLEKVTRCRSIT